MNVELETFYVEIEEGWNSGLKLFREKNLELSEGGRLELERKKEDFEKDILDIKTRMQIGIPGAAESPNPQDDIEYWQKKYDWYTRVLSIIDEMLETKR